MNIIQKTVLAMSLLVVLPQAQAHRQWLLPSSTQIDTKEPWVTIDGAVSEQLFDLDTNALLLDNLLITAPDGSAVMPETSHKGKFRSSVDIKLSQKGTYRISQASQNVMASYSLNGEQKRWRGTEEKMAKELPVDAKDIKVSRTFARLETFVSAGKPSPNVLTPIGQGLELVSVNHPNELFAKETAKFTVLLDGKPLANTAVSIIAGGVRYRGILGEIKAQSDANGVVQVTWPYAGMYWLNVNYPKAAEMQADGTRAPMPEKRYTYAATLEVLPQ